MIRTSGFRAALITAAAVASALTVNIPARAGFSLEELAGFEVTHLRGVVNLVSPAQKVIEVVDPEGHKEIITVGIDLAPLGLQPGDGVDVSVLDGLVVDLQRSATKELSFNREDIIMPLNMGPLKKGMRLALASGTARVIKLSEVDRSISLMGPLGGIHNLDVLADSGDDLFPLLNAGDLVDFRLIQPVAVQIKKASIAKAQANAATKSQPLLSDAVTKQGSLKAELLQSFEITKVFGTVQRIRPAEKVLELRTPYGHDMLITSGVDLSTAGIKVGEQVTVDLLDGLVVDLRKSSRKALTFAREDVILSEQFGPVRQGAKVAMTSGTAEVVKVSENDHELSLRGPFGGVHNLDVHGDINGEPVKNLNVGDYVDFRAIRPIAIAIRKGS
ncbi:MAG: hypothetical protein ISQ50_01205 [Synechococcus sp. BS307-5m-G36]|nr:hypothetical protein [Synechococcus sp. BS307-5m-G36]